MLDILKFLFSDFWIWAGATIWIGMIGSSTSYAISQARGLFIFGGSRG